VLQQCRYLENVKETHEFTMQKEISTRAAGVAVAISGAVCCSGV